MSTTLPSLTCTFKPNKPKPFQTLKTPPKPKPVPPTDRVIDFGKHKGKMLGTLPSTYLKWVSKNLRAGDTDPWARLADQVLEDPVYQDRVEWEFAESVMSGSKKKVLSFSGNNNAAFELVEISERFGWDNEDKVGWSEVDFELLGSSKSGRIPRLPSNSFSSKNGTTVKGKETTKMPLESNSCEGGGGDKRSERRERMRQRRVGEVREGKMEILKNIKGSLGEEIDGRDRTVEINSRFPGRESLLKKVLDARNNRRFS